MSGKPQAPSQPPPLPITNYSQVETKAIQQAPAAIAAIKALFNISVTDNGNTCWALKEATTADEVQQRINKLNSILDSLIRSSLYAQATEAIKLANDTLTAQSYMDAILSLFDKQGNTLTLKPDAATTTYRTTKALDDLRIYLMNLIAELSPLKQDNPTLFQPIMALSYQGLVALEQEQKTLQMKSLNDFHTRPESVKKQAPEPPEPPPRPSLGPDTPSTYEAPRKPPPPPPEPKPAAAPPSNALYAAVIPAEKRTAAAAPMLPSNPGGQNRKVGPPVAPKPHPTSHNSPTLPPHNE